MVDEGKNILQNELDYYEKNKSDFMAKYKEQYVLIKGEEFAGSFTTAEEAYKAGVDKFGNEPFLIKQVLEKEEVVTFPALTVGAINVSL